MKILYLMHVDWNWIKQRPHFIAEGLAQSGTEIDVLYKPTSKKYLTENKTNLSSVKAIMMLRGQRFSFIRILNQIIYKITVRYQLKTKAYDYVYITHPSLFINDLKSKVIYDCMDDNIAFSMSEGQRNKILKLEKKLIEQSYFVIFSSDFLFETVSNRIGYKPSNCKILNNAINIPKIEIKNEIHKKTNNEELVLTYIGTISDWFDVELLRQVQKRYTKKKIIFNLYGPVDSKADFSGFNLRGSIPHEKIFEIMSESDILIMPFILNELIKSVNPVKLYEYIYSGKPVIAISYGETQKFNEYVYLYEAKNCDSFISCLDEIDKNGYKGKSEWEIAKKFVESNTWEHRVKEIIEYL